MRRYRGTVYENCSHVQFSAKSLSSYLRALVPSYLRNRTILFFLCYLLAFVVKAGFVFYFEVFGTEVDKETVVNARGCEIVDKLDGMDDGQGVSCL